jgi:hypothetical protein
MDLKPFGVARLLSKLGPAVVANEWREVSGIARFVLSQFSRSLACAPA